LLEFVILTFERWFRKRSIELTEQEAAGVEKVFNALRIEAVNMGDDGYIPKGTITATKPRTEEKHTAITAVQETIKVIDNRLKTPKIKPKTAIQIAMEKAQTRA
jgi:hypothetical protein